MTELPISKEKYQVYFFTCPAYKPFQFGCHPWVVTVLNSEVNRFEIIHKIHKSKNNFGHVYKNYYPKPTQGIQKHFWSSQYWESTLIGQVTGDENSLAERMVYFIHNNSKDYEYKDTYHIFPGPNSNTYVAWILKKFPEAKIKMPWNAFGKNYLK